MPSEDATSTFAIVLTRSRIEPPLFGQFVGSETVISKENGKNWLYILKGEAAKSFDEFDMAINALDAHLLQALTQHETSKGVSYFLPVLNTPDKVLLGFNGSPFIDEIFDKSTGDLKNGVQAQVWSMKG